MAPAKSILKIAAKEIGVREKPAGSCNVKYNTEYYGRPINNSAYAWCVVFLWWIFKKGDASSLFYGGKKTANCDTLYNYYKSKDQIVTKPKPGDIIFFDFNRNKTPDHVGIVYSVNSNGSVITIEGNTSATNQANGGYVQKKVRAKSLIFAFARPNYTIISLNTTADKKKPVSKKPSKVSPKAQFVKDVQAALGAKVDGIAGPETFSKTVTISAKVNSRHKAVKPIQVYLKALGYDCGVADGIAGTKFTAAIKKYQLANKCVSDGEITAKKRTWKKLLGL